MAKEQQYISQGQFAVTMASGFTAPALFTFARNLAVGAGRQALWSLLGALLVGLVSVALLVRFSKLFPEQTPVTCARVILGRPLATVLACWWILIFAAYAAATLRQFADLVKTFFLPRTPTEVTMLLVVVAALYINWHGLEAIARFNSLVYPLMIGLVILIFLVLTQRITQTEAMLPPVGFDPVRVWHGMNYAFYEMVGVETLTMLLPFVRQRHKVYRTALWVTAANGLLLLFILLISLGVLGVKPLAQLEYPGASLLRVLRLPGLPVERLGAFVALSWTQLMIAYLCVRLWTVPTALAQVFHMEPGEYRYFLFPVALLTMFMARWPSNPDQLDRYLFGWVVPLATVTMLVSPAALLVLARLRGLGQRS